MQDEGIKDRRPDSTLPGAGLHAMRVMVADDHMMILDMIGIFLANDPGILLRTASAVDGVLEAIATEGPFDLVLLDLDMPGMEGTAGLTRVIAANAGHPVAILTGNPGMATLDEVARAGAAGLIAKTSSMRSLANAIRFMASGERYFPLDLQRDQAAARAASPPLSEREISVLRRLGDGLSNRDIGAALAVSEATVKMHMKAICRKLGVSNRTQAAISARRMKLV